MDEETQNKFINTKIIQHMDEAKVLMMKVNKFKESNEESLSSWFLKDELKL